MIEIDKPTVLRDTRDLVIRLLGSVRSAPPPGLPTGAEPTVDAAPTALLELDPEPELLLQVVMKGASTTGPIEGSGGQEGVLYHLRTSADGPDLGPLSDAPPLAAGTTLFLRAVEERTGQEKELTHTTTIETLRQEAWAISDDTNMKVTVAGSTAGVTYSLFLDGILLGAPKTGDGKDLSFSFVLKQGHPVRAASIRRGAPPGLVLEQFLWRR